MLKDENQVCFDTKGNENLVCKPLPSENVCKTVTPFIINKCLNLLRLTVKGYKNKVVAEDTIVCHIVHN